MPKFEEDKGQIRNAIKSAGGELTSAATQVGVELYPTVDTGLALGGRVNLTRNLRDAIEADLIMTQETIRSLLFGGGIFLARARRDLRNVTTSVAGNALLSQIGETEQKFTAASGLTAELTDVTDIRAALAGLIAALEAKEAQAVEVGEALALSREAAALVASNAQAAAESVI